MKKKIKPETPLAIEDAAISADHRKIYPQWDEDAQRFGIRIADFNAGFIKGSTRNKRKAKSK
jgi:hypothetical protein